MATAQVTPDIPTIKVFANKTLLFVEGEGTQRRHLIVEAKPTVQEAQAWIKPTGTFQAGVKDGSIIEVTGRSTLAPALVPPTVDEVVAQRGCTPEEAQKIVDLETVKFNQGEYPYPVKVTLTPDIDSLLATGLTREQAERALADPPSTNGKKNGKKNGDSTETGA